MTKSRLVLHRLRFDEPVERFLHEAGLEVLHTRSVAETVRALDGPPSVVVIDVSIGSSSPERIAAAVRATDRHQLLAVTRRRGGTTSARCSRLGLDRAWVWPEGAFEEINRQLGISRDVRLRTAERANVDLPLNDGDVGFSGTVLNISSSGALIECGPESEDVEKIGFEFAMENDTVEFDARVIWRRKADDGFRMGVQFKGLSDAARRAIEQFVRERNVVRAHHSGPQAVRPRVGPKVRVQYGRRTDYYRLEGDLDREALLIQTKAFFVPYGIGDTVQVRLPGQPPVEVEITDLLILDPDRMDSRAAYRVVGRGERASSTTGAPAEVPSPTGTPLGEVARDATDLETLRTRFGEEVLLVAPGPGEIENSPVQTMSVYTLTVRDEQNLLVFDARVRANPLRGPRARLGRMSDNEVVLVEPSVSGRHAVLEKRGDAWSVTDLGSSNGTAVGKRDLESGETVDLVGSEPIFLGRQRLHVVTVERLAEFLERLAPYLEDPSSA